MDNFISGLEISVIGFTVTIVTLFVLAEILIVFTKVFGDDKKGKEKRGKAVSQKVEQQVKPAAKTRWR